MLLQVDLEQIKMYINNRALLASAADKSLRNVEGKWIYVEVAVELYRLVNSLNVNVRILEICT
jgi:hypothetical protein